MDVIYRNAGCVLMWIDDEGGSPRGEHLSILDNVLHAMRLLSVVETILFTPIYEIGQYASKDQPVCSSVGGTGPASGPCRRPCLDVTR
jgi:hypothetical protein